MTFILSCSSSVNWLDVREVLLLVDERGEDQVFVGVEDLGEDHEVLGDLELLGGLGLAVEDPFDVGVLGDGERVVHELADFANAGLVDAEVAVAEDHLLERKLL